LRIEDILTQCAYKPGYSLRILEGSPRRLFVGASVNDSRDGVTPIHISMDFPIPDGELCERDWLKLVRFSILSLEVHELGEWFTYKGKALYDPHSFGVSGPAFWASHPLIK
jgi:hypothetical protein